MRIRLVLLMVFGASTLTVAGEPVVLTLPERASVRKGTVTVGQVVTLNGGDVKRREQMASLDLADSGTDLSVSRKQIGFRLQLAGFKPDEFVLNGEEKVSLSVARKPLATERVIAVAKAELARRLGKPSDELIIDLAQPVVVKLPEVADGDDVDLTAVPKSSNVQFGRTQMNVTIKVNGLHKLDMAVMLNAACMSPGVDPSSTAPPPKTSTNGFAVDATLVKARQPVLLTWRINGLTMHADCEALQDGKIGQVVRVQNTRSKQTVSGKVVGPGEVEALTGGSSR